ncbi:MAG: ABC transporter ATP-binding protein [Candidatus Sumerlaeia bacterium]
MTADAVIQLEKVWRKYDRSQKRPRSLKEAVLRLASGDRFTREEFWANREISFTIREGEIVGFCGSNGSGKSTLLRILARIDPLTYGRVTVRGKIAALLEVTAGFHPMLTGRENIGLNGAIMGLSEKEIASKVDSIIEFARLGDFIDSPVHTYSAGMYMRLGFAIASHVEADILLIDEVLAVGDAVFQKRCADWLERMRQARKTILIVSHDLYSLYHLCSRVIWLDQGRLVLDGDPAYVLSQYNPEFVPPEQEH